MSIAPTILRASTANTSQSNSRSSLQVRNLVYRGAWFSWVGFPWFVALAFSTLLAGCATNPQAVDYGGLPTSGDAHTERLRGLCLAWHIPPRHESIRGLRLFDDAPPPAAPGVAVV